MHEASSWEFLSLGAGDPHTVSAQHGRGTGDLLDVIVARLEENRMVEEVADADDDGALRVAIVGRPNVGKSTLFNQLIGEERSVVHDLPGTTRDAIDTLVATDVGLIRFIDTAGMRRRAKTEAGLETYAVLRSLDALDRSDIAILVIDATVGATGQDQRLAERISAAGCPSLVVLNKWELVAVDERDAVLATVGEKLAFLGDAPVMKTTATSGKGVHRILPGAGDRRGGLPKARADRRAQPRDPRPAGQAARADRQDPLRRAGRHRAADVHALHRGSPAPDVPALRRTIPARAILTRIATAASARSDRIVTRWCEQCDRPVEGETCEICGETVEERGSRADPVALAILHRHHDHLRRSGGSIS